MREASGWRVAAHDSRDVDAENMRDADTGAEVDDDEIIFFQCLFGQRLSKQRLRRF